MSRRAARKTIQCRYQGMTLQRPSNQILRLILWLAIVGLTFSEAAAKPAASDDACIELTWSKIDPVFDQWSPARLLRYGYAMTANSSHALEWYRKAALADDTRAKHNVGIILVLGLGMESDVARGIAWLDDSFADGSVDSALALGDFLGRRSASQRISTAPFSTTALPPRLAMCAIGMRLGILRCAVKVQAPDKYPHS